MNKSIYKFPVNCSTQTSVIQKDATILSVGVQDGRIFVWALVDIRESLVTRRLPIQRTGHGADDIKDLPFIGTIFSDSLVFHIFDGGEI